MNGHVALSELHARGSASAIKPAATREGACARGGSGPTGFATRVRFVEVPLGALGSVRR